jgi:hypothetical protein
MNKPGANTPPLPPEPIDKLVAIIFKKGKAIISIIGGNKKEYKLLTF